MGKAKRDTKTRRDEIVREALNIIGESGAGNLHMTRIARRVNIVPSALYRHFKGKEAILDAIVAYIGDQLSKNVEKAVSTSADPLVQLHGLLELHVRLIKENRAIPRLLFSEEIYGGNERRRRELYQIIERYLAKIASIIEPGQRKGLLRNDIDARSAAVCFLGLVQPATILWHLSDGLFDVTRHAERGWTLFADSLTATVASDS